MSGWDFDPIPELSRSLLGFYWGHGGTTGVSLQHAPYLPQHATHAIRMLRIITNFSNAEAAFLTSPET